MPEFPIPAAIRAAGLPASHDVLVYVVLVILVVVVVTAILLNLENGDGVADLVRDHQERFVGRANPFLDQDHAF